MSLFYLTNLLHLNCKSVIHRGPKNFGVEKSSFPHQSMAGMLSRQLLTGLLFCEFLRYSLGDTW